MPGEINLDQLLATMAPKLRDEEYIFCTFPQAYYGDHSELEPIASYMEAEGLTLVIPRHRADEHGIPYEAVFKCITLSVHSSLEAVGLTAVVATKLAEKGISANVIAAFYHDHIFVQSNLAKTALFALKEMGEESP